MSRYLVKFFKRVVGGNGREVESCQRWFEVEAPSQPAAVETAKQRFCEAERLSNWSVHADRVHAAEVDFPS